MIWSLISVILVGMVGSSQANILTDAALAAATAAAKPSFCRHLDCPKFLTVPEQNDKFDVRRYDATVMVTTNITTSSIYDRTLNREMFYRLFHYIAGNNSAQMKIAMTTPVLVKRQLGSGAGAMNTYTMYFLVPFSLHANTPIPTEASVSITQTPSMLVYVKQFGGFTNEAEKTAMATQLKADVTSAGGRYEENLWFSAGYDGPRTLTNRTNEVWLMAR